MREILFRGKSLRTGKWVYGFLHNNVYCAYEIQDEDSINTNYPIKEQTVGQYTGLTDKNENKIFEGDVVCCRTIKTTGRGRNYLAEEIVLIEDITDGVCAYLREFDSIEIIGNIYDNPHLIKDVEV